MPLSKAELTWPDVDVPSQLVFTEIVPKKNKNLILRELQNCLSTDDINNADVFALSVIDNLKGRYMVKCNQNFWFVRISSRIGYPLLEQEIIEYLHGGKVAVNPIISIKMVKKDNIIYRFEIRPFIKGRHFNKTTADLATLAKALKKLHRQLKNYKRSSKIKSIAFLRYKELGKIREHLFESLRKDSFEVFFEKAQWAKKNRRWFEEMTNEFDPELQKAPDAQCLHGEIYPGNVIFCNQGPTFIDFEESVHTFASPTWDLAYLVQRFCLFDTPPKHLFKERLAVVENNYRSSLPKMFFMMRQTSWLSMATLIGNRLNCNTLAPLSEYMKFIQLEQQAKTVSFNI